ncbi:MAG: GspE/PulE family protein [Candidatus Kerfeldbacteria bacterium]|nr:GspE/PulE family protein [Candidatus Kerfeldbacteria bacterium]
MELKEADLRTLLVEQNYVSGEDMNVASKFADAHHISVIEYLQSENILTHDLLGQAIAEYFHIPYIDLNTHQPTREQIDRIPEDIAKAHRILFCKDFTDSITVTTDQPEVKDIRKVLAPLFPKRKIEVAYSLSEDINAALAKYRKTLDTRFSKILSSQTRVAPELIDEIIQDALIFRASDIHIEPQKEQVIIRFRVDGILQDAGKIARTYYESILNRIKVQGRLRIDEHFSTQDGAMHYEKEQYVADIRISIIPTIEGEKVVMRLLSQYVRGLAVTDLGLSEKDHEVLVKAYNKPFGMILVTGPTGSGKSTTLYAALKELNDPEVNITTIEDPVEYKISGVNQIQVNAQTHITFAKGLRSIVRQDPDIILVGEIRDTETAEIAVNAALTGHLLLSTFHANDAATAIPRLLDMAVEPFLLASTLELVIAQRLVRKICERCRVSRSQKAVDIVKKYPQLKGMLSGTITLYAGKGCRDCNNTGFRGRVAIFEMIVMNEALRQLILERPSSHTVWEMAEKNGARSMFEDGIDKVTDGITTIDELLRVANP